MLFGINNNKKTTSSFKEEVKRYIDLKLRFLKLDITEKLSLIISIALISIISIFILAGVLFYSSYSLMLYMNEAYNIDMLYSSLIIAGVYILVFMIFLIFRKSLVINPIVRVISKIINKDK